MFRLFTLSGLLLFFASARCQTFTSTFHGRVTDKATGIPLSGALVELHEMERTTRTDSAGYFSFNEIRKGSHHLHVRMSGYAAATLEIEIPLATGMVEIALMPTEIELRQVVVESSATLTDYLHQSLDLINAGKEELDRMRGMTLSQSLSMIPGINAVQTGVGIAKPVIRGLSGNRVLVADLGMKQEGQQWGNDHGLEIDQFAPEQIEIIKGPASILFGSDAMGGVIHILPPSVPQEGIRGEWHAVGRSNNEFAGTSLMFEGNRKGHFFRVRSTINQYGDYKIPARHFTYLSRTLPIENKRLKNTAGKEFHFSVTGGTTGEKGTLKITLSNFHQVSGLFPGVIGVPTGPAVADDGFSRNIDLPRLYVNHLKAAVNASWIRPKGWIQFDGGWQENIRKEEVRPHAEGYAPVPSTSTAHLLRLRTSQVNLRWHGPKRRGIKFIPGVSALFQNNRRDGYEFLLPDYLYWTTGAYVFAERLSVNGKSSWNGGVRTDYGNFRSDSYVTANWNQEQEIDGYVQRAVLTERTFVNVSGGIGRSWFPNDHFNLKVNFGKSFRMPNAAELSINGVHHGTYRHEQGDGGLRPENGYQLDIAALWRKESWLVKISPYFNYFDGYIYLRPRAEFSTLPDGGQLYKYTQNDAIYAGAEVYMEYHPLPSLHIESGTEYVMSHNLQSSLSLPFTPPFQSRMSVEFSKEYKKKKTARWFIGARSRVVATQERTDRNEKPTAGYVLFDAYAGFDFHIRQQIVQFRFSLMNALDRQYMNHLSLYRQLNLPEQGRNFSFSLKVPFAILKHD